VSEGRREKGASRVEEKAQRKDVDPKVRKEGMSLLKRHTGRRRHVGRRVAGVAVGVALLVVGLEAPAYAVVPTVTGFTPASGDDGCVVQITGTGFTNPTVTSVTFGGAVGGTAAANFAVISDTEIWATAPAGSTSGAISVTNGSGTGISPTGWIDGDPAGCSPTADSFAPTCGPAGTDVTITGTNLLRSANPLLGANVRFAPFSGGPATGVLAAPSAGATPSFTSVTVDVPAGAADGPIGVRTFANAVGAGADFSPTQFDVGTCITETSTTQGEPGDTVIITGVGFQGVTSVTFAGAGGPVTAIFTLTTDTETFDTITATVPVGAIDGPLTVNTPGGNPTVEFTIGPGDGDHVRTVTLKLSGALRMKGKVKVADDTAECISGVPVKLQRKKKGGGWKTLKTVTTNDTGAYSGKVRNKPGKYRSVAPKVTLDDGSDCLKDASPVRRN
jgi:IPT/TIG domain